MGCWQWGEGTQIEPAVPKTVPGEQRLAAETRRALQLPDAYSDYTPRDAWFYLNRTLVWAERLAAARAQTRSKAEL